jgi:hypothetical protein
MQYKLYSLVCFLYAILCLTSRSHFTPSNLINRSETLLAFREYSVFTLKAIHLLKLKLIFNVKFFLNILIVIQIYFTFSKIFSAHYCNRSSIYLCLTNSKTVLKIRKFLKYQQNVKRNVRKQVVVNLSL